MELGDDASKSERQSVPSVLGPMIVQAPKARKVDPVIRVNDDTPFVSKLPDIPTHVEFQDGVQSELGESFFHDTRGSVPGISVKASSRAVPEGEIVFKMSCPEGNTHRIRCEVKLEPLLSAVKKKIGWDNSSDVELKFFDDEGDAILVSSDECLVEAVELAQKAGNDIVKLSVSLKDSKRSVSTPGGDNTLLIGLAGAVAVIGIIAVVFLKPKK